MSTPKRPSRPAAKPKAPAKDPNMSVASHQTSSAKAELEAAPAELEAGARTPLDDVKVVAPEAVVEEFAATAEAAVETVDDVPELEVAVENKMIEPAAEKAAQATETVAEPVTEAETETVVEPRVASAVETRAAADTAKKAAKSIAVTGAFALGALVRSSAGAVKGGADLAQELVRFSESRIMADLELLKAASGCRRLVDVFDCEAEYSKSSIAAYYDGATRLTACAAAMLTGAAAGLKRPGV